MSQNYSAPQAHEKMSRLATTAGHMADALSYLIRVAAEAKMRKIATRLAHVRVEILVLASEDDGDTEYD